jgi:predicted site-specific integrase-resolvase
MTMKASMFLGLKYERMFMRLEEICDEIDIAVGTARNKLCAGTFPIRTRKSGKHIIADIRDVGDYIDECRKTS